MKITQQRNFWWLQAAFYNFLLGDLWWARVRLVLFILTGGLLSFLVSLVFEGPIALSYAFQYTVIPLSFLLGGVGICAVYGRDMNEGDIPDWWARIKLVISLFFLGLSFLVANLSFQAYTGRPAFYPPLQRYLIIPLAAIVGAFFVGARYIEDVYDIENYGLAQNYLLASFFGMAYPGLMIINGKKDIPVGKLNRLDVIGGPGYVTIRPGTAVLFEHLEGPSNVYSTGRYFLSRFESIKEIVNLEDLDGHVASVSATTKDGIKVQVRDIRFRYRIWPGAQAGASTGRTSVNPYPFSVQAVRNMVYNRSVSDRGMTPWFDTIRLAIEGDITNYINQHKLDHITAPRQLRKEPHKEGDPRAEIRKQLESMATREKLKNLGAQLLWCDIGHFEIQDKAVIQQRLDTWKAGWIGNATVTRAYGEAQRLAFQELGRAEAQRDILVSINHAFDDINLSKENKVRNIRNVILIRTAQVLDSINTVSDQSSFSQISSSEKPSNHQDLNPEELDDDNI